MSWSAATPWPVRSSSRAAWPPGTAAARFDDLVGAGWRLISLDPDVAAALPAAAVAWFEDLGGRVVILGVDVEDVDGTYKSWFARPRREHRAPATRLLPLRHGRRRPAVPPTCWPACGDALGAGTSHVRPQEGDPMKLATIDGRLAWSSTAGSSTSTTPRAAGSRPSRRRLRALGRAGGLGPDGDRADVATGRPSPLSGRRRPAPRQVFAIGLNYAQPCGREPGEPPPEFPPTFTKFPTCLAGPTTVVALPERLRRLGGGAGGGHGPAGRTRWPRATAWSHVAGLCRGPGPLGAAWSSFVRPCRQFSLGKSFPGFGPIGPWLVTPDELDDPDDLALECSVNGETMQKARTSDLIFSVSRADRRAVVDHAAAARRPRLHRHARPASAAPARRRGSSPRATSCVSSIEGIGTIRTRFTSKEQP